MVAAIRREIRIWRLLRHPNIVKLYEVIETPEIIYFVMEYVDSGELFDYLLEKGRLQEDHACVMFQQVAILHISNTDYEF